MAEIYHYRDHQRAVDRWSNMERLHLMRKQGLIPAVEVYVDNMPCDVNPFELSFVHQDGDVA